jgi:hypothetical protein
LLLIWNSTALSDHHFGSRPPPFVLPPSPLHLSPPFKRRPSLSQPVCTLDDRPAPFPPLQPDLLLLEPSKPVFSSSTPRTPLKARTELAMGLASKMVLAYGVQQGAGVINQLANSNKPSPYPQNAGQAQYGAPGGHAQSYYQQGAFPLFPFGRKAKSTSFFAFSGQPQQQQNGYAPRTFPVACHRGESVY